MILIMDSTNRCAPEKAFHRIACNGLKVLKCFKRVSMPPNYQLKNQTKWIKHWNPLTSPMFHPTFAQKKCILEYVNYFGKCVCYIVPCRNIIRGVICAISFLVYNKKNEKHIIHTKDTKVPKGG